MHDGGAVSRRSRIQVTVAHSNCENEYVSMSFEVLEEFWWCCFFMELFSFLYSKIPFKVCSDIQGEICTPCNEPILQERSKHVESKVNFTKHQTNA